jgi:hemerythrin-like domain-containing protein
MRRRLTPSEVRLKVLNEHRHLRVLLSELQTLSRRVATADREAETLLRERGAALHDFFCQHLDLEDRILFPALRAAGPRGEEQARRMEGEHREQRELMEYILRKILDGARPPLLLARDLGDLAERLHRDICEEEDLMLGEGVLRDDATGVDADSG